MPELVRGNRMTDLDPVVTRTISLVLILVLLHAWQVC